MHLVLNTENQEWLAGSVQSRGKYNRGVPGPKMHHASQGLLPIHSECATKAKEVRNIFPNKRNAL